jgi:D-alanyl-D-alanine-carboxypeptidase/D-alanyl-D-alanine-endopeptidase
MSPSLTRLVLALLFVARPLAAEISPLTLAIRQAAAELPAGGFVLAELSNGTPTYAAAGRPLTRRDLPPQNIIFEIGSITKAFTGLLLAQTVLEGKASLDDPIARHLPADLTLAPDVAAITLRQLSAHTSGLPRLPDNLNPADLADPYADYTVELLYDFLRRHRLESPGPHPSDYSNLGVGLLGHILERVHGMRFAALVEEKICRPLGLDDTVIELSPEQLTRFAPPHSGSVAVSPWNLGALPGAGALRSTAADLTRFAAALMDPESPLAKAFALARQPVAPFGQQDRIGLGFMIANRHGQDVYYHGGGTGGSRSVLEVIPAAKSATILLLNNDAPEPAALVSAVHRPQPPAGALLDRSEVPLTAHQLHEYTGVYAIDARGRFTAVVDEAGRLRIRLTGQPFLPVFYAGNDRFFARAVPAEFQFARDATGAIRSLTLHQDGREVPAQRTGDAPNVRFPQAGDLKAYTGSYQLAPGLVFDVTARGAQLVVKLTGQPALPVFNTAPDRFEYDVVEAALTFERDADGQVTAVILHQHGMDQRAPRVPQ